MNQVAEKSTTEPKPVQIATATLRRRQRLSPSFVRLTLAGGGMAGFKHKGFDQWFRMFLPREGPEQLPLPTDGHDPQWYSRYRATPQELRPCMRYVTVRDHRHDGPHGPEIDVDVVVHGEPGQAGAGPLSNWAQTAEPGGQVGILDQGLIFRPESAAAGVLLIGDETAVPAIAGILSSLPADSYGRALIEVPRHDDVQVLAAPAGFEVEWMPRSGAATVPGEPAHGEQAPGVSAPGDLALAAARPQLTNGKHPRAFPHASPYVYAAGESAMIKALNQTLRDELAWPSDRFTTVGYWHHDRDGHT